MSSLPLIVAQHAESAASLWLGRQAAVAQPHYALANLAKLDCRLEGHLDGLRVAGTAGWKATEDQMQRWQEPGEVFTAAVLALDPPDECRIDRVLEAATASSELARPLASAIAWLPPETATRWSATFLVASDPAMRRVGLAASAIGRRDPGQAIVRALDDPDALLRARAMRAVGELGRLDLVRHARENLFDENPTVGFWATWSSSLLCGEPVALEMLRSAATSPGSRQEAALQLYVRRAGPAEAADCRKELRQTRPRAAILAAAAQGVPELVPSLLEAMRDLSTARVAGEAFAMITGADLAALDLDQRRPEGFESGPTEDPADDNVEMDPDENLPWPDREKIAAWWKHHASGFTPGTRYLLGQPISDEWLQHVLRHGYQRQRAAAALELAIRHPGTPLFEVRAPGFRQQELLS